MIPNQDIIISCTKCTLNVPIAQTTYDRNGKNLICFSCYNLVAKGGSPEKIIQNAQVERVNYECLSCHFKFSRNAEFQFGGKCFNCGKKAVQAENTQKVIARDRKSLLDY